MVSVVAFEALLTDIYLLQPSTFDKTWNQAQYHAEKGK